MKMQKKEKIQVLYKTPHAILILIFAISGALFGAVFYGHHRASYDYYFRYRDFTNAIILGAVFWNIFWFTALGIIRIIRKPDRNDIDQLSKLSIGISLVLSFPLFIKPPGGEPWLLLFSMFLIFISFLLVALIERKINSPVLLFYFLLSIMITTQLYNEADYYKLGNLHQVIAGDAPSPWRYRILIPFIIRSFRLIIPADPNAIMFFFRIFLLFHLFLATKLLAQNWVSEKTAVLAPVLYAFFLYPTYDLIVCTDFAELLITTLFLLSMVKKNHVLCLILIIIGTANREVMAFMIVVYFIYFMIESPRTKRRSIILWTVAQAIACFAVRNIIVQSMGGEVGFQHKFDGNITAFQDYFRWITGLNHDIDPKLWWLGNVARIRRLIAFAGGSWILALIFVRKIPRFLFISGFTCSILWFGAAIVKANIHETRVFYPLLPFLSCIIPILLAGEKNGKIEK